MLAVEGIEPVMSPVHHLLDDGSFAITVPAAGALSSVTASCSSAGVQAVLELTDYAPLPLRLPVPSLRGLVAVGPHLKNTFTLVPAGAADAYVSQHIGDLESLETLAAWREGFATYCRLFRVEPEVAVRDLHPGYLSTRIAGDLGLARVLPRGLRPLAPALDASAETRAHG